MPRKPVIDDLHYFKKDKPQPSLRDKIHEMASHGEKVSSLIDRAVLCGIGTRKQIRSAIYLGSKSVHAKFRLGKGS